MGQEARIWSDTAGSDHSGGIVQVHDGIEAAELGLGREIFLVGRKR